MRSYCSKSVPKYVSYTCDFDKIHSKFSSQPNWLDHFDKLVFRVAYRDVIIYKRLLYLKCRHAKKHFTAARKTNKQNYHGRKNKIHQLIVFKTALVGNVLVGNYFSLPYISTVIRPYCTDNNYLFSLRSQTNSVWISVSRVHRSVCTRMPWI